MPRLLIPAAIVVLLVAIAGCAPAEVSGPRIVTTDEAQLLAVMRFKNFDAGTRSITTSFRDAGSSLGLTGWVDYSGGAGYGLLSDAGKPADLLLWNQSTLAALPYSAGTTAPLPPPEVDPSLGVDWQTAALSARGALHPLLAILTHLGNDRPDNPLLLRQGGTLWLRSDRIGDTVVTVFAGPTGTGSTPEPGSAASNSVDPDTSNTRYWVDESGLLLRLEVRLGGDWVTVDFGSANDVHIADPFPVGQ